MNAKKILCGIVSAILVVTSGITVFAANGFINADATVEPVNVELMTKVADSLPFEFDIVSYDNSGVVAKFVSTSRISEYPYLGIKGTKTVAEKTSTSEYVLEYNKEYTFVYAYAEDNSQVVYNAIVSIYTDELNSIDVLIENVVKNVIPSTQTRAAGVIYETEPNDIMATADQTNDDYDNIGALSSESDNADWWKVVFAYDGQANFWLGNIPSGCDFDLVLYPHDSIDEHDILECSINDGTAQELIQWDVQAGVEYYIKVEKFEGYSSSQYLLRAKNYPYVPTIPSNSIGVHVTDITGNPIENAVVYVYRQRDTADMYPQNPVVTDESGYAIVSGLTSSGLYGINVIANNYASKSKSSFVNTSTTFYDIVLSNRSSIQLNDPIAGFSPAAYWAHGGGDSAIGCTSVCSLYTRLCPHEYMNVYMPQNFGWRYRDDSRLEFHQAIDVSLALDTPQYNVFTSTAYVTQSATYSGCGKTVQLYSDTLGLYATYMHLNSYPVSAGTTVADGEVIGYTGNTGTVGYHMHFSLATEGILFAGRDDESDPIIIDWDAEEVAVFVDPLSYIN